MSDKPIYLRTRGEIAEIVLNRPAKHNALNREVWETIPKLIAEVEQNPDLKVLILRGSTPEAFAAGADISEFSTVHATAESAQAYHASIRAAYDALTHFERPTIAMIQGICFGGGCAIALCCDMRYADTTSRFCIPPAKLGIAYSLYETKRLNDLVGPSKTKEMLMGAKVIEAEEAVAIGLATRLFAPEDIERGTFGFAEELCQLSQFTIRAVKSNVGEILNGAHEETETSEQLSRAAFKGPDYIEGRNAFMEKRKPKFTYR
jgi:enoyl-CoA hydratase/carnithine racemase